MDSLGSIDLSGGQPLIIVPSDTPTTEAPMVVTTEPTVIPTTAEITGEPTTVPTTPPTTVVTTEVTVEPTVIPTTEVVTVETTAVPTTQPTTIQTTIVTPTTAEDPLALDNSTGVQGQGGNGTVTSSLVTADIVPSIPAAVSNATIELNQSSGSPQLGGFDLSWTANLTDPPLNTTNLQGTTPGSQYWEINATTGSNGYYPLDLVGLITNSLFGIWIHDVTNVTLDGMGHTLQYNGDPNMGATGVIINESSSNVQIVNLTLLGWDTGISIQNSNNIYVMDNTTITGNKGTGTTGSGIVATNSNNVFIASNLSAGVVTVQNNALDGIVFNNVTGGLINNTYVTNNGNRGVNLTLSHGITVDNVTANSNALIGIYLYSSSNNNLTGNTANSNTNDGIYLRSSSNNLLTNNTANSNTNDGIYLTSSGNSTLENNTANNNRYGIYLTSSSNSTLENNTANYNRYGIYLTSSSNSTLENNTANYNNRYGIYLASSNDLTLANNTANYNSYDGIYLAPSHNNTLSGNTANNNRRNGISVDMFSGNITLSNNTANHNTISGINLWLNTSTVSGNTANDNGNTGISVVGRNNKLSDNTANANKYNGFFVVGPDYTLSGNMAKDNGYSGLFAGGANNTLSGNTAINNSDYGIFVSGSNITLTGNTANENTDGGILVGGSEITLSDNTANNNHIHGIYLDNTSHSTLSGNTANSNDRYGISLTTSSNNNLINNTANQNGGVAGSSGYGIYLNDSWGNNLVNNIANQNGGRGGLGVTRVLLGTIMMSGTPTLTLQTGIGGDGGTGYGLYLNNSWGNNLTGNTGNNNGGSGGTGGIYTINNLSGIDGNPSVVLPARGGNGGTGYGLYLDNSWGNNLTGNTENNNGGTGGTGINATICHVVVSGGNFNLDSEGIGGNGGTGYGLYLNNSWGNNLTGNTENNNGGSGGIDGILHVDIITLSGGNLIVNNIGINGGNGGTGYGLYLSNSRSNNLDGNTENNNGGTGGTGGIFTTDTLDLSSGNITENRIGTNGGNVGNGYGFYLNGSSYNNLTSNWIVGNCDYGLDLKGSTANTIYNNFFNNTNNTYVSADSTGNIWNTTPTPGTNIAGGPNLGGNYWATPTGTGWSQTHPDIGNGFAEPYNITAGHLAGQYQVCHGYGGVCNPVDFDYYPLVMPTPTPAPGPSGSSGSYNVVIQPLTPGTLPYDSSFTGNTIPGTMESCHSYTVGVTVKNTGTLNWTSANGVILISSSSNGFTFDPSRYRIPPGVVVQPGQSYTFPVTITVPCPMKDGTYQLRFRMAYTVQTKSGPVEVPFGDSLTDGITVGASLKSGVKSFAPKTTIPGSSGRFTTSIPKIADIDPVITITPGYYAGISRNILNETVARNFLPVTGLLWTIFVPDE